jgi:hypothetical protein
MRPGPYPERRKVELYTSHWKNQALAGLEMVPIGLQAAVLVGAEQASEVEARRPLVLGLQDSVPFPAFL